MKNYYLISEEDLEKLKGEFTKIGLPHPQPLTATEGYVNGAGSAIARIKKNATEIPEELYDEINKLIHRFEGEKGDGGFKDAGEK